MFSQKNSALVAVMIAILMGAPPLFAADPLKSLAQEIKQRIKKKPLVHIAVLNFTYDRGKMSTGSFLASERLVTYLSQAGLSLVERKLLHKILEEQRFWQSGVVNAASLKKMSGVMGVDAVVVGTMNDLSEEKTDIAVRLIRVDTGEVWAAGKTTIDRIWTDVPRMMTPLNTPSVAVPLANGINVIEKINRGQTNSQTKQPSRRPSLSHLDSAQEKKPYNMTPVPFSMPKIRNLSGGSNP